MSGISGGLNTVMVVVFSTVVSDTSQPALHSSFIAVSITRTLTALLYLRDWLNGVILLYYHNESFCNLSAQLN